MRLNFITVAHVKSMLFVCTLLFAHASISANFESMERIKDTVKTFVLKNTIVEPGESIDVIVNQANAPIEVKACSKIITASFPKNANREQLSSIELSCDDTTPWHVMVPVDVQLFSNVIVAKKTIPPRESITEDDIDFTVLNKNRLYSGYFTKKEEVIGTESSHLITAGTVLTKKNVQLPLLIHRNQSISLISQSNSVIVSMQGVAKSEGALNAVIKVFNPSSKKTLDAIVIGPNKAQIAT